MGSSASTLAKASSIEVAEAVCALSAEERDKLGQALAKLDAEKALGPAELSDYFANGYLRGELFQGTQYSQDEVRELLTFRFDAADGPVHVWQHAFDLRDAATAGTEVEDLVVLHSEPCLRERGEPRANGGTALRIPHGQQSPFWQGRLRLPARALRMEAALEGAAEQLQQ